MWDCMCLHVQIACIANCVTCERYISFPGPRGRWWLELASFRAWGRAQASMVLALDLCPAVTGSPWATPSTSHS